MAVALLAALGPQGVGAAVAQTSTSSSASSTSSSTTSSSTSTTREPRTTTSAATTTSATSTTVAAPAGKESGLSDTALILIAAIIGLLLLIGVVLLLMRRRAHQQWRDEAREVAAEGRALVQVVSGGLATMDQPASAASTWADADHRGSQVHIRLQTMMHRAPDQRAGDAAMVADRAVQGLRSAVESDRALRLGPPAPTADQLSYSGAVVRERATELSQALDELDRTVAT